jgi:hypothetical protein
MRGDWQNNLCPAFPYRTYLYPSLSYVSLSSSFHSLIFLSDSSYLTILSTFLFPVSIAATNSLLLGKTSDFISWLFLLNILA